jgi:transglutaminase-like putative cysteine protease
MPSTDARRGPPIDASTRGWCYAAAAACLLPLLLQLPRASALGIAICAIIVAALSWRRPLPWGLRILLALAVFGAVLVATGFMLGRDAGCALLAAMLALKPSETTHIRDARSLLGFALFAPFATFLLDQGPLSLVLGLTGACLALIALLRLADFEAGIERDARDRWRRLRTVWKLVLVGLPLAMAAFWLFPRLASPLWGTPGPSQARPGLSESMTPSEWVDLLSDDTPALRVQFFGATPRDTQRYWRGYTLWNFDGRTWTRARWIDAMPPAAVTPSATRWDYQLELEPTDRRQVVALDLPLSAPEGTTLDGNYGLSFDRPLTELHRWRMHSAMPVAFDARMPEALRRAALQLPAGFNPRTLALAQQWRAEAGGDDAAIIRRAMSMFHDSFAYTLAVPLAGRNAVDEFLFDTREGYCQHFSSAFVVLMRAAGIPARVVTGYAGGNYNRIGGYWLVRRSDAHAWAEVWLPGRGWVREDPTAAVSPERVYDTLADRATAGDGAFGGIGGNGLFGSVFEVGDWMRRGWNDFVLGFDAERQRNLLRAFRIDADTDRVLLAAFIAAAMLALAWMAWRVAREQRERDPLLRAWRGLEKRYARRGLGRAPHEPAMAWARRLNGLSPNATVLQALTARFSEWRYALHQRDPRRARELLRDLRAHRPFDGEP